MRMLRRARKYGLHTIPGSQNGKLEQVNFLNGIIGVANTQLAMDYIRIIVRHRERGAREHDQDRPDHFFPPRSARMIRSKTEYGAGHGPIIGIHDGFIGVAI
ncbi:hypothetical protein B0H11DRAFT_1906797 [Mycena galericulata]|nr:hypothetical protein B0H11DRAFT_1906797 [Mycena galericulata]